MSFHKPSGGYPVSAWRTAGAAPNRVRFLAEQGYTIADEVLS
jgi:hypothetical protein